MEPFAGRGPPPSPRPAGRRLEDPSMRAIRLARAAAATLCLTALLASPAAATYPGSVGRLAFAMSGPDGNIDIYTALPNGANVRRLTTDAGFDACAAYSA